MRSMAAKVLGSSGVMAKFSTVKSVLERIDSEVKLHHYKIRNFQPNVEFSFERGDYVVKTASNGAELEQCLKLRYEVFHREYKNKTRTIGVDIDRLDYICDHLVVFSKSENQVIGTYRMNSTHFTSEFYSAGEFEIDKLLEMPGNKLELGRACIDKQHRNGVVISLLWRGIAEYIQKTNTQVLFGCASVKTMDPLEIGLLTTHLRASGHMDDQFDVVPTKKYKVKQLAKVLEYIDTNPYVYQADEVNRMMPALFKSYLKAGAKVCGDPAIDREFHCIDFLIVMKVDEMSQGMKGKFKI